MLGMELQAGCSLPRSHTVPGGGRLPCGLPEEWALAQREACMGGCAGSGRMPAASPCKLLACSGMGWGGRPCSLPVGGPCL